MAEGRVLVIDDDPVILNLLRLNFELEGYDVLTASDGEHGLALAEREQPDAVVLDVMMPGLDGLEVARRLRSGEATRLVPVLLLSAKAQAGDIAAGRQVAGDYVTKPFDPLDLLSRVQALIRRPAGDR